MKVERWFLLAVLFITPLLAEHLASKSKQSPAAQPESEAIRQMLDKGNALAAKEEFQEALESYRAADNLSNHACADCYLGMVEVECHLGDVVGALRDSARAAEAAKDDHLLAAQALVTRGMILVAISNGPTDEKIKEAEEEFRKTLSLDPKRSIARFELGILALKQGRIAEGIAQLNAYISGPFANPRYVAKAKRLIADPNRARALPSDDFSFTTLDGEKISKASLRGKVVLLDFWGSWCPPCRASVPMLAGLHREFADRPFQIVGISSDDNETSWKSFIASNHMNWPEYIDLDGQMQGLFEIQAFPTFIVLDREGMIQFRQSGLSDDSPRELESVISKAIEKPASALLPPSTIAAPPTNAASTQSIPSSDMTIGITSSMARGLASMLPLNTGLATVGNSPGAANAVAEAAIISPPEDVENGDVAGNIYRNDFFGLSYKFPSSWIPATPELLDQQNHATIRWMKERADEENPAPNVLAQTIFQASPDARGRMPLVRITVEQVDSLTLESVRRDADYLKRHGGVTVVVPPQEIAMGKRRFFRTDFELPLADPPAWVASFETLVARQYRVTLEIHARSKQELTELVATAQSLSITKQ